MIQKTYKTSKYNTITDTMKKIWTLHCLAGSGNVSASHWQIYSDHLSWKQSTTQHTHTPMYARTTPVHTHIYTFTNAPQHRCCERCRLTPPQADLLLAQVTAVHVVSLQLVSREERRQTVVQGDGRPNEQTAIDEKTEVMCQLWGRLRW